MYKNYFCHDIHSSLNIKWSKDGWMVSPCCFTGKILSTINFENKSWFAELWPQLRKDNISNQPLDPRICQMCINDETVGKQSRRLGEIVKRGQNVKHSYVGPKYIEISMEYTCNQACMICGTGSSSLWRKYTNANLQGNSPIASDQDIEKLLENIDLTELDTVQIIGGEPLLTDKHTKLLDFLEKKKGKDLSKIELWYHTNGSCIVSEDTLRLWKKFKLVFLYFSLDDIDEAFNYQRYPGDWKTVIDNMHWFREHVSANVLLRVERTVSLLNAHRLADLEIWKRENFHSTKFNYQIEMNTHMAQGSVLAISNISDKHLNFLKDNDKNYKHLSKFYPIHTSQTNNKNSAKVLEFVRNQDQRRNISISSYFPEFYSLYQEKETS
jgi:MoaA/NifB/PqqE/SkfB family radical SAM enzyme